MEIQLVHPSDYIAMIDLNCAFRNKAYRFNSLTGWLTSRNTNICGVRNNPSLKSRHFKAERALDCVLNPFKTKECKKASKAVSTTKLLSVYVRLLIWLHRYFYPGIWLASKLRLEIFEDGVDAADVFCEIHPYDQRVLCLPRSVFVATTSKQFKKSGALFIGVFLPSRHMHAWVIENDINVYRHDHIWTNFTPVSIMI